MRTANVGAGGGGGRELCRFLALAMFFLSGLPLACDQVLRGALAAGRKKEGELSTTSLSPIPLRLPVD